MVYRVSNIKYDSDSKNLPRELLINVKYGEDVEETLSDEISNITGFCHFGFSYEAITTRSKI